LRSVSLSEIQNLVFRFQQGRNAAALEIAEQYVHAFGNLARTNNTILLPSNTGDMSSMIASALSIYGNLQSKDRQGFLSSTSQTPAIESSPLPSGSKPNTDPPAAQQAKNPTTKKETS
jgi:hypothetical protein